MISNQKLKKLNKNYNLLLHSVKLDKFVLHMRCMAVTTINFMS